MNSPAPNRLPRAWYEASIARFLTTADDAIVGALARGSGDHAVEPAQMQAWLAQITLLKSWLADGVEGSIYFEFNIPRMGRRIDVVLLLGGVVLHDLVERSCPHLAVQLFAAEVLNASDGL